MEVLVPFVQVQEPLDGESDSEYEFHLTLAETTHVMRNCEGNKTYMTVSAVQPESVPSKGIKNENSAEQNGEMTQGDFSETLNEWTALRERVIEMGARDEAFFRSDVLGTSISSAQSEEM